MILARSIGRRRGERRVRGARRLLVDRLPVLLLAYIMPWRVNATREKIVANLIRVERRKRGCYVGVILQGKRSNGVVLKGGSVEAAAWVLRMKREWSSIVAPEAWDVYVTPNTARRLRDAAIAKWQPNNHGKKPAPATENRLRTLAVKSEITSKFEKEGD